MALKCGTHLRIPRFPAVQLALQLALLLVQRLHFHKQFVALLVDLDWLVSGQLGQFLLGERLVEVLPEFLVLLGQAVDFLILALRCLSCWSWATSRAPGC